ncbi:MAG TPA: cytochrome c family protein [Casimicrobiaceae bacterium]|nr:cytochrome c family protein [Casimicrobiaceae bacterium]
MRSAALLTACLAFGAREVTAFGNDSGGDATRGAEVYTRCQACHALKHNRTGPKHCGVVGRKAGSVPNFAYSPAMRRSKLTWNEQTLDRFLADPMNTVPGTSMTYAGVSDPQDRADLIAYLRYAGGSELCK